MKKIILSTIFLTSSIFAQETSLPEKKPIEEHVQGNFSVVDPQKNDNISTNQEIESEIKDEVNSNFELSSTNGSNTEEIQDNQEEIFDESTLPKPTLMLSKELLKIYRKDLYTSYTIEEANKFAETNFTLEQFHYLQKKLGFSTSKRVGMTAFLNIFHIVPESLKEELNLKKFDNIELLKKKTLDNGSSKFIVINIPSMQLHAYQLNEEKNDFNYSLSSKVIVGALNKKTPSDPDDSFNIIGVKYNPNWTVPPAMVKRNIIMKDGTINEKYIKSHNLTPVTMSDGSVKYRQLPGKNNALGLLKFETDSKHLIFLHDTNERHLFENNVRYNSSGCIRVKEYLLLAEFLGIQNPATKIEKGRTYIENTQEKIPVYFTHDLIDIYTDQDIIFLDAYNKNNL